MPLTFDTANLVVESSASITDLPAFHAELRDWEDGAVAAVLPVTHTWKALNLGGGAFMYQADFINGWTLKFPAAGNYTIAGNLNASIVPVAGVYVERKTSAAYVTTALGGSGGTAPTAAQVADAVWQRLIETSLTAEQLLRLLAAQAAGDATGLDGPVATFKSLDGTRDRIVGSVGGGARTVTLRDGG